MSTPTSAEQLDMKNDVWECRVCGAECGDWHDKGCPVEALDHYLAGIKRIRSSDPRRNNEH